MTRDVRAGTRVVRAVLRDVARRLRGHDLALLSAGATLYGALAGVPSLLVAIALARPLVGDVRLDRYGAALAANMPAGVGADRWVGALFDAALRLGPASALFAVFAASAYGDGLRRSLSRLAPVGGALPSWRVRLRTLPLLGLAPLLLLVLLVTTPAIGALRSDGWLGAVAAVFVGLVIVWVLTWAPLTWVYRVVAPGRPSWWAALAGGMCAGAFISGFLQGFLLFAALPVDLGRPFGGLEAVGVTSALLLWLWVLHLVVCAGYALTWATHQRLVGRAGGQ